MTTDLYAKCPCGSGKKIKFCCRDIISEIERIERMLKGEQRTAAIEKINKLLEKHPDRPALLTLKAQVYLELQQVEDAEPVIARLMEVEPENPSALAMQAALLSVRGEMTESLKMLHRALRFSDGVLSQMVYRSYLSICFHLIQQGELIAAYAHLLTLVSITKGQDRASVSMLMNVTSSEKLPAIFQGLLISDQAPDDVTWHREFEVAIDMYRHGDWSEAATMLEDMNRRILDAPVLLRNQAILQAWTCQEEKAIKAFRYYAAIREVDLLTAVEAEACSQVLEATHEDDTVAMVAVTHEIDDANAMMEKLLSDNSVDSLPVDRDPDSDAPPPKGQFVFFDRDLPQGTDDDGEGAQQLDDCPRELCSATLFGKQTDRSARLTVIGFEDDHFEQTLRRVNEVTGENIGADDDARHVVGRVHKVERMFRPNFRVSPNTSLEGFQAFQQEWIASQLENVWPELELTQFDGKTARVAATERKFERRVLAAILNLEIWADRQPFEFDFDQLRKSLGLPVSEKIDPSDVNIRSLSPTQLRHLVLPKLNDEDLKFIFEIISVRPNGKLLYRIGKEVLGRPSMVDQLDFVEVHERVAELAPTTDEQLDHLGKARDMAVGNGESPASWLVAELDIRFQRGEADVAKRLITEIQSRYLKEPGVAQMFASVLSKYGLMPAAGGGHHELPQEAHSAVPAAVGATAAPASGGTVWTPDGSAEPDPSNQEGGGESKLWVPGMD